ncbi:hypothetical protein FO519_004476 [Halicephalobus sp. NKZ332]|nr:hypothetical protein FO519_004476 [Halicephalobus sp. NKZ332]
MRRIHTLNNDEDDHRPNLDRSEGEDSDEDGRLPPRRPQEYYVGGSERSGQQVLGPERGEDSDSEGPVPFFNTRLGGTSRPGSEAAARVNIELYDDGFTVDNSALRPYNDPANVAFMDALKRRETPPELRQKHGTKPIDVHVFKHPGKYEFKPFSGAGHRLGAVVPETVTVGDEDGPQLITDNAASVVEQMRERGQQGISLTEGDPTVRIQFRFPHGQRITGVFNPEMTILNHLRSFVVAADPAFAFNLFSFYAGFPPKQVEDEDRSIQAAGLSNSVVTIRLI